MRTHVSITCTTPSGGNPAFASTYNVSAMLSEGNLGYIQLKIIAANYEHQGKNSERFNN